MSKPIRFTESRLHDTRLTAGQVPVVTTRTLLVDVTDVFLEHECRHLLVQDNDGLLTGIVSVDDLNQAMRGAEDDAEAHWHHRTVESLLSVTLEADGAESEAPSLTANH